MALTEGLARSSGRVKRRGRAAKDDVLISLPRQRALRRAHLPLEIAADLYVGYVDYVGYVGYVGYFGRLPLEITADVVRQPLAVE